MEDNTMLGSSAAESTKTYSAKELADVYKISRPEFFGLDLELISNGWDSDYIYEFLYNIKEVSLFDLIICWIIKCWETNRGYHKSYSNFKKFREQHEQFCEKLSDIKNMLKETFEAEEAQRVLQEKMLEGYNMNETEAPDYFPSSSSDDFQWHLHDLPKEVGNIILINDDETYNCFVEDLRGPVKNWVDKHNLKDWNVVKFTCMLNELVARDTPVAVFAKLLISIMPEIGDQEANMKKRTDCNKNKICNFDISNMKKDWKLKRDVKAVEECMANTLEKCA